jgi:exodeoxyribonuclease VII large subunit
MSVSQFTSQIKAALKGAFPATVTVRGEVSNCRGANHAGHWYFSVKDAGAILPVVLFANAARNLKFEIADGLEVIVTGRIDVYELGGKYNFILSSVTPVGTGALELAYRQLYDRLEAEGLFAAERKRAIPLYPRTLALVTSRGAAGLQDMLKVLRRHRFLRLIVVHVPVQGEGAAQRIAAALDGVNRYAESLGGVDVILLGRGGGSFEDLFEFSREEVARAVGRSEIPVITGIGHEVDVAIADLVADHHAHTPTEAATFAVRMWNRAAETVERADGRLRRESKLVLEAARGRLERVEAHDLFADPRFVLLEQRHQRADDREQKLHLALRRALDGRRKKLDALEQRLLKHDPRRVLLERRDRVANIQQRLSAVIAARFRRIEARLAQAEQRVARRSPGQRVALLEARLATLRQRLEAGTTTALQKRVQLLNSYEAQLRVLGPDSVLKRGFSITRGSDGSVLRSVGEAKRGEEITTTLQDGEVRSRVE